MIITRDDERKQSTQQKRRVSYADYAELERRCRHLEEQCSTKDNQLESARLYIEDLLDTQDILETRHREHLEEQAEWFEERGELLEENTSLKLQKHDALTEQNKDHCEACQLHSEVDTRRKEIDAIRRRILKLDHLQMGSSDKLVALDYLEQAAARYWNLNDLSLPFHPVMEHMATRLGLSDAQMTRINKAQKTAQSWKYKVDRKFKERVGKKDIYDCVVTVELDKLLSDPEGIEKPEGPKGSHQGGARVRLCKSCGSDDLDRYALEYCRSCQTSHAQLLPGLRSDANIHDALDAVKQDRLTIQDHVHDYAEESEHDMLCNEQGQEDQKHDAFDTQDDDGQHTPITIEATVEISDNIKDRQPIPTWITETRDQGEKHDAFDEEQPTDTTPIAQQTGQADNILTFPGQAPAPQIVEHEEHPHDAEQLQANSNMQDKETIRESLHDAPTREETANDYPHIQVGVRVNTPAGLGTVSIISQCPVLHRPRCSIRTDTVQPNGSQFAAFDLAQVTAIEQGTLSWEILL